MEGSSDAVPVNTVHHFQALFGLHPQAMWIVAAGELRFLAVNAAACQLYGYSEQALLGMRMTALVHAGESADPQAALNGRHSHVRRDGSTVAVQLFSHGLLIDGQACYLVQAQDLTSVESALFQSEQLHRRLIDQLPHQIFWKDLDLRYAGCNAVFAAAAGLATPAEVIGTRDDQFPWAHNAEQIWRDDRAIIATGVPLLNREDYMSGADGEEIWFVINKMPLHDQNGKIVGVLGTIEDVSERKRIERASRLQSRALEASMNAIVITAPSPGGNLIEYANPAFTRISGYTLAEVTGRDCRFLQGEDREQEGLEQLRLALRQDSETTVVLRNYRKDGSLFWNELHIAPVADADGRVTHHVGVMSDITNARRYQAELEHQANFDALTDLPNRNLFNDRLAHAIVFAERYRHALWVVFIDLDNFKLVNDSLGHDIGDQLLKAVGERLASCVRGSDTIARLGGDEFMLLLLDHGGAELSPQLVQRVLDAVAAPLEIGPHELALTCSIGVSVFPKDGNDAPTLLKHADIAMYRAKEAGRNQLQFYTDDMNARITERTMIENHLRSAIARDQFVLHYQPRVDLRSGRIVGMEALLRWQHPQLGLVAPGRFIGIAEETGMIVEIGNWVLRTACLQNKAWQLAGLPAIQVAVNVSARQFRQADFADQVVDALAASGLAPAWLELELTESLMMQNVDEAVATLDALKRHGVALSIDDFGTGFSSLNYLKRFPIDYLKIDQCFVHDMLSDPSGAAIVRSIIALGHSLRFKIIAEGVETEAQMRYLSLQGCDEMQGYYFSRPQAAPAMAEMLAGDCSLIIAGADAARARVMLLVEHEAPGFDALARSLQQDGHRVLRAHTAAEAFDLLALHHVHAVLCAPQLPDMDGIELLRRAMPTHPDTLRMVLGPMPDPLAALAAVNSGAIARYFAPPWDEHAIRAQLRASLGLPGPARLVVAH